ncbi:MAG TPA: calcium/sodium antiporter [Rhizomicrobium sp.]|jgi:cation:H+ antiporter|nr:calcium/sodium antiporter [Rhizomicrobium sp.]
MMAYAFLAVGLVLLVVGSDLVLRGGVGLSRVLGLSPLLIGLVVVSAGTSLPELVVSLQAAFREAPDLAVGNVVGSNIVNILLILGLGALVRPLPSSPKVVLRDGSAMIAASVALLIVTRGGIINEHIGWLFLVGFIAYLVLSFFTDRRRSGDGSLASARAAEVSTSQTSLGMAALLLVFGLVALFFGARYLVDGGVAIARDYHVPEAVIGLTVIAIGTSLPELATTVFAAARGQTNIAVGNLIGSNIFNILLVLGATAVVHPLPVSPLVSHFDVYVMTGSALLVVPLMAMGWRVSRFQGLLLALSYMAYIGFIAYRQGLVTPAMIGLG